MVIISVSVGRSPEPLFPHPVLLVLRNTSQHGGASELGVCGAEVREPFYS